MEVMKIKAIISLDFDAIPCLFRTIPYLKLKGDKSNETKIF